MSNIQTKATDAICSAVGDINKHEKFKKLSKQKRIEKLQEVYDLYGVKSNQFFVQVKPFIMWTVYRNLRGMPASIYLEDLINNAYEELVIAFEGGDTTHYNKDVHKEAIYGTDLYYSRYKNIGEFIMTVVSSSVSKFRSKFYKRKINREDVNEDISDRINFTDFEQKNDLTYELEEPEIAKHFSFFKFNKAFLEHLQFIRETAPKNNILYNFMIWQEKLGA